MPADTRFQKPAFTHPSVPAHEIDVNTSSHAGAQDLANMFSYYHFDHYNGTEG